jgi:glycosyltransferase involved in cell wall biosynthesis
MTQLRPRLVYWPPVQGTGTPTTEAGLEARPARAGEAIEVSVVIPCLNEAKGIETVVSKAREALERGSLTGEVIVVDNGSSDGSPQVAQRAGARVVHEPRRGYGSAYLAGFAQARGEFIVMGDGDDSYDFSEVARFLEPLRGGADLVIGNRMGRLAPGSMPWLHRHIGNPLLTATLNLFFSTGVRDAHCGMRAFRRDLLPALDLRTTGMEFASEQVIRASKLGLDIRELDIGYRPRKGESKLSSFSDGWRHLRFLLVHSPTWLFVVPGALMLIGGILGFLVVLTGIDVFGRQWEMHSLIACAALCIVGAQVLQIGAFGRAFAFYYLGERDRLLEAARTRLRLEHGLLLGGVLLLTGAILAGVVLLEWLDRGLGTLGEERLALVGLTLVVLGLQVTFGAFFLSILGLRRISREGAPDAP